MATVVKSFAIQGIEGYNVDIETICHKRCQALLNFYSFQLSYNSRKGGAREREYKITNGNLYIHEAKTDGSYDESWIATDEEVHRFLSKYLWKLSLNDVII